MSFKKGKYTVPLQPAARKPRGLLGTQREVTQWRQERWRGSRLDRHCPARKSACGAEHCLASVYMGFLTCVTGGDHDYLLHRAILRIKRS